MMRQIQNILILAGWAAVVLFTAHMGEAADKYWANTGTDYKTAGNWTNGSAPGSADVAWFYNEAVTQPYLATSFTNNALRFSPNPIPDPATTAGSTYTLTGQAGVKLMLTASGTGGDSYFTLIQKTTGTNVIAVDLQLSATSNDRRFDTRAGALEISGSISSVDDEIFVYLSSSGTIFKLSGNNTFTGTFSHTGLGTLMIANANALSAATLILGNHAGADQLYAFLDNVTGAPLTLAGNNPVKLISGKGLSFIGTHSLNFGTGPVTMSDTYSGRDCPLFVQNARMTFGGPVGEANMIHGLQKLGPGTLELRAASSYSGITYVSGGVLLLNHADALGVSNLVLRGISGYMGVLGLGTGDFARSVGTGAGQVQWSSTGGFTASGGFAAYNANRVVNLGGASAALTWGAAGFIGGTFALGAVDADAMVDFQNPIALGGSTRTMQVDDGSAEIDARLSGVISGANNVIKSGNGTLDMAAANTYTGSTTVNGGTLKVSGSTLGAATVNAGMLWVTGIHSGNVSSVAANASIGGSGTITGKVTLASGPAVVSLINGAVNTLTLGNGLVLNNGNILNFELRTTSSSDLIKLNAGTVTITGSTTINVSGLEYVDDGIYTLIDGGIASTNGFIVGMLPPDKRGILSTSGSKLQLQIRSAIEGSIYKIR